MLCLVLRTTIIKFPVQAHGRIRKPNERRGDAGALQIGSGGCYYWHKGIDNSKLHLRQNPLISVSALLVSLADEVCLALEKKIVKLEIVASVIPFGDFVLR